MIYGYFYRWLMRMAHRYNWHYAPIIGPNFPPSADGRDWQRWCKWCGFRESFNLYPERAIRAWKDVTK